MGSSSLMHGDCLLRMKELPDNSVDSVITDSPYGLSFMGKRWDYDVPSKEIWTECLRVLKPGGHLLSFGGTRTYHRLVVNIEDAGFEIRDQIQWLYGSGFPKSHDVSKGIDKQAGAKREVVGKSKDKKYSANGVTSGASIGGSQGGHNHKSVFDLTAPSTDSAKQWQGWGTALKPANEPIVVARKPLERGLTVAENVLKYGTGALNIDGTRIETSDKINSTTNQNIKSNSYKSDNTEKYRDTIYNQHTQGRWPANILFDEEAAQVLDEQSGKCRSAGNYPSDSIGTGNGTTYLPTKPQGNLYADSGGASRFFYVAKASKSERNRGLEGMPLKDSPKFDGGDFIRGEGNNAKEQKSQNFHPTVKPIKLMSYLIKLVTPPNGTVLDPFMGSGSTGVAAKELGFNFIGIEMNEEYLQIAEKRMEAAV
jgi:DNA modification methylase